MEIVSEPINLTSDNNIKDTVDKVSKGNIVGYNSVKDCFNINIELKKEKPETTIPFSVSYPKDEEEEFIDGCFPSQLFALYIFYYLCKINKKNNILEKLMNSKITIGDNNTNIDEKQIFNYYNGINIKNINEKIKSIDKEWKTYTYWINLLKNKKYLDISRLFRITSTLLNFNPVRQILPQTANAPKKIHDNKSAEELKQIKDVITYPFNFEIQISNELINPSTHNEDYFNKVVSDKNIIKTINDNIKNLVNYFGLNTQNFGSKKKKKTSKKKNNKRKKLSKKKRNIRRKSYKKVKKVKLIKIKL